MRLVALVSGGKDSVYAIYWALNQAWDVPVMLTVEPETADSWMFHYPNTWITALQARSMHMKRIVIKTTGKKEKELEDLKRGLEEAKGLGATGLLSGALASEYQKTRLERVSWEVGLRVFNPLWHKDQGRLMRDMLRAGFKIMITGVSAEGLGKGDIGRVIDNNFINRLEETGISPAGEGGEFETLVVDGPLFSKPITIEDYKVIWEGDRGYMRIDNARL